MQTPLTLHRMNAMLRECSEKKLFDAFTNSIKTRRLDNKIGPTRHICISRTNSDRNSCRVKHGDIRVSIPKDNRGLSGVEFKPPTHTPQHIRFCGLFDIHNNLPRADVAVEHELVRNDLVQSEFLLCHVIKRRQAGADTDT